MTTEHTPIPWFYGVHNLTEKWFIAHQDPKRFEHTAFIAELHPATDAKQNAELIVRAVNSFDAMKAALRKLIDHAQEKYPHFESTRGQQDIYEAIEALALAERGEK